MASSIDTEIPQFTASERPVRTGDKIAFFVWMGCFFLIIATTLIQFLLNWLL